MLGSPYVVHELRLPTDPPDGDFTLLPKHVSELSTGRNIAQAPDGTWPDIFKNEEVSVFAAPILHSVPSVGYVINEATVPGKMDPKKYAPHLKRTNTPLSILRRLQQGETIELVDGTVLEGPARRPGRKLAILGDTYDPSPIAALSQDCDILIHECTNAHLPGIDPNTKAEDTYETVEERAKSRGHSTPQMAGAFARRVGAKRLILNHFSARYAGDDDVNEESRKIMEAIRDLAAGQYGGHVLCARDLMSVNVDHNHKV